MLFFSSDLMAPHTLFRGGLTLTLIYININNMKTTKNTTKQTAKNKALKAADNPYRVAIAARDAYDAASKSAMDAYDAAIASAKAVYRAERKEGATK